RGSPYRLILAGHALGWDHDHRESTSITLTRSPHRTSAWSAGSCPSCATRNPERLNAELTRDGVDLHRLPRIRDQLLRKALSERHQQLEWAIGPNVRRQQCPHHVFFLPEKADPRLRVSGNVQILLAD